MAADKLVVVAVEIVAVVERIRSRREAVADWTVAGAEVDPKTAAEAVSPEPSRVRQQPRRRRAYAALCPRAERS